MMIMAPIYNLNMKKYKSRNFEKELDRFLRAMMSVEEEKEFLAFLRNNRQYADRAYLSAIMIKEIRKDAFQRDRRIVSEIQKE